MRKSRFTAGVLAGVTTLSVLVGCAGQQIQALEPKLELRNAAKQLGDAQQAGFTVKLTGTADDFVAAVKLQAAKDGDPAGGPDADDITMMKSLFDSSFTIAYDKAGAGADDDRAVLAATVAGVTGTEIRIVDGLYARVPVTELATGFGASAADVKALAAEAGDAVPGVDALLDGKWVTIDRASLEKLSEEAAALPADAAEQEKTAKEFAASATNLVEGATIVRDEADDKHLIVTSSTTKAYDEVKRLLAAVGRTELGSQLPATAPADKPIVLDLWIDNGRLTAAEIDILQFVEGATGRVAARIEMTTGTPIEAPQGATRIDVAALLAAGVQPYAAGTD